MVEAAKKAVEQGLMAAVVDFDTEELKRLKEKLANVELQQQRSQIKQKELDLEILDL